MYMYMTQPRQLVYHLFLYFNGGIKVNRHYFTNIVNNFQYPDFNMIFRSCETVSYSSWYSKSGKSTGDNKYLNHFHPRDY